MQNSKVQVALSYIVTVYFADAPLFASHIERLDIAKPNLAVLGEYRKREKEFLHRAKDLEKMTERRDAAKKVYDDLRKRRLEEFMEGFQIISMKLKEMYQVSLSLIDVRLLDGGSKSILSFATDDHTWRER